MSCIWICIEIGIYLALVISNVVVLYVFSVQKSCIPNSDPPKCYTEPLTHGVYCVWHKSTSDPNQTPWGISFGIMIGFRKFFSSHSLSAGYLHAVSTYLLCMYRSFQKELLAEGTNQHHVYAEQNKALLKSLHYWNL